VGKQAIALNVNNLKTVEDTAKVTINDQQEVAYALDTKIDDLG